MRPGLSAISQKAGGELIVKFCPDSEAAVRDFKIDYIRQFFLLDRHTVNRDGHDMYFSAFFMCRFDKRLLQTFRPMSVPYRSPCVSINCLNRQSSSSSWEVLLHNLYV